MITLKVQPVFNNQKWGNELVQLQDLKDSMWTRSAGRVQLEFLSSIYTTFTDIPFQTNIFPFTTESADAPSKDWMIEHIYPLNPEADEILFICTRADWHDTNPLNGYTYGYTYNHFPATLPSLISTMVEAGDKSWQYPNLNALTHYGVHEICHSLYYITDYRTDHTHVLDNAGHLEDAFNEFNYQTIQQAINNKRSLTTAMIIFKKDGDDTLYFPIGKTLVPFSNSYAGFLADFKDAIVVNLAPDEFLKFKIAGSNVVKAR